MAPAKSSVLCAAIVMAGAGAQAATFTFDYMPTDVPGASFIIEAEPTATPGQYEITDASLAAPGNFVKPFLFSANTLRATAMPGGAATFRPDGSQIDAAFCFGLVSATSCGSPSIFYTFSVSDSQSRYFYSPGSVGQYDTVVNQGALSIVRISQDDPPSEDGSGEDMSGGMMDAGGGGTPMAGGGGGGNTGSSNGGSTGQNGTQNPENGAQDTAVVPVPASLPLAALAFGLVGLLGRRRR